ncbi:MAG: hypothetical protein HRT42_10415, partial [Campylobacteraceae bacterium]|nr:hypothetical protein [Campylobacteraceae bacterium]
MNNIIKSLSIICASLILSACQGSKDEQSTSNNIKSTNENTLTVNSSDKIKSTSYSLRSVSPRNNTSDVLTNEDIILDFSININSDILIKNNFII